MQRLENYTFSFWLQVFKEISVMLLIDLWDNETETSVTTYDKEYNLFNTSLEKSPNRWIIAAISN